MTYSNVKEPDKLLELGTVQETEDRIIMRSWIVKTLSSYVQGMV